MQKQRTDYRERLTPSLWILVSAAIVGPMSALVVAPLGPTLALITGAAIGALFIAALFAASPVVEIRDGVLHAGRARIAVDWLGAPVALNGAEARQARGPGLDRNSWLLIRGGIDGVVIIPLHDPDDPTVSWVVSTRTPDRFAAAVNRSRSYAQSRQMSPTESS
ncbi:MAG TPA: DUF3093 domain-containing protein [Microbacterium sp.]|nr:DUF3093 domain-containing protein [Microbacterium sp.]